MSLFELLTLSPDRSADWLETLSVASLFKGVNPLFDDHLTHASAHTESLWLTRWAREVEGMGSAAARHAAVEEFPLCHTCGEEDSCEPPQSAAGHSVLPIDPPSPPFTAPQSALGAIGDRRSVKPPKESPIADPWQCLKNRAVFQGLGDGGERRRKGYLVHQHLETAWHSWSPILDW